MSSAFTYYLAQGAHPKYKATSIDGLDTISVWTPATGKRVVVTDVSIFCGAVGATIAFYFDTTTGYKIAEYGAAGSVTISPNIGAWESTVVSGKILARVSNSATNGARVTLTGFELEGSQV